MNSLGAAAQHVLPAAVCGSLLVCAGLACAQAGEASSAAEQIRIVELQGTLQLMTPPSPDWVFTTTNQVLKPGYLLRTGPNSRVALRWSDESVVSIDAETMVEILPPPTRRAQAGLQLLKGILSFFHRATPGRIQVLTHGAAAGVEGTEFVVAVETVDNTERTTLSLIDGKVQFSNEHGTRVLTNRQQAIAQADQAPVLTAGFVANNILQWAFYYPAVVDLRDLPLKPEEEQTLGESLAAYRTGDLLAALAKYPTTRRPDSGAEQVYRAALFLCVGQVEQTEGALAALPAGAPSDRLQRLATALRQLIAAVKRQPNPSTLSPQLSTELLAASYYEQSRATGDATLRTALALARQATTNSPEFGFAWARVAELEFSFGHTDRALDALNKSLALSPRNAQALASKGFLLAAQNKTRDALDWFKEALTVDSALGNAWLGRGLCRIRLGDARGGREDLLVAAALEPQRSLLRSYLGKAYGQAGDAKRALHELDLAKGLDPNDPTPWLYSALLNREENRINTGVSDLEKSIDLNENRAVYRSRFLLDEDRAVRSSSLANLYQSAGMDEVAVRQAARAVSTDYANYSAHQFLSESYNALRDPTRFNLRYETPWFSELLLADLLSPVGGTPLSQHISQQEYSRLFEHDRIGLSTDSSYRSDGQYRELASQFGVIATSAWSLDLDYQHNNGVRPNNDLDRIESYTTIKQQITPQDSLLLVTKYQDYHSGDNFQYFNPLTEASRHYRLDEYQHPIVLAGYHREWAPGVQTLALGGFLQSEQRLSERNAVGLFFETNGPNVNVASWAFDITYQSEFEAAIAELNQVLQNDRHTLVFGGRYQRGHIRTSNQLEGSGPPVPFLPPVDDSTDEDFERGTAYAYYSIRLLDPLTLLGGVAYDHVRFPENFRNPPITPGEAEREQVGPKAALTWTPARQVTVRGAYSHSLGGVTLDQSVRLEPTQLAGFVQTFRTLIPESLAGPVAAEAFETAGLATDVRLSGHTYLGLQGERLAANVTHAIGLRETEFIAPFPPAGVASTPEKLHFLEHAASLTLNQIVSDEWAFGLSYRFTRSKLRTTLAEVPVTRFPSADRTEESDLHQFALFALFNHASGFFARPELDWYLQQNREHFFDYTHVAFRDVDRPGDEFPQLNLLVGYRFPRQHGDMTLGLLNVTGEDYHLKPLNSYSELPRERVFYARLRFRF